MTNAQLGFVLHYYQPPTQDPGLVKKVAKQTYASSAESLPSGMTINISGILLELLNRYGRSDIIEGWREVLRQKEIEILTSSNYHTILPLIPPEEARRQIEIQNRNLKERLGIEENPRGLWLPEMAFAPSISKIAREMGIEYVLLPESSCTKSEIPYSQVTEDSEGVKHLFRHKDLSMEFCNLEITDLREVEKKIQRYFDSGETNNTLLLCMDGEWFGHHNQNIKMKDVTEFLQHLKEIGIELKKISDIIDSSTSMRLDPTEGSWLATQEEAKKGNPYPLWKRKGNAFHSKQWKQIKRLLSLSGVAEQVASESGSFKIGRKQLDESLHSCQMFWATPERESYFPIFVLRGALLQMEAAFHLHEAIQTSPDAEMLTRQEARKLYNSILKGFNGLCLSLR